MDHGIIRLNLGCGRETLPVEKGWVNIDSSPTWLEHPEIRVHDITHGLPYCDSSVGEIRAYDIIEHISQERMTKIAMMNEFHRALIPEGLLDIRTPHPGGPGPWQDPTHRTVWNREAFEIYFTHTPGPEFLIGYGITAQFRVETIHQDKLNLFVRLRAVKPTSQEKWLAEQER